MNENNDTLTAFAGHRLVASGELATVLSQVKETLDRGETEQILLFEDASGQQVDFDFHGSLAEVLAQAMPREARHGPGRPRLGVVNREVSLLPRHWEWLERQPQSASATLRRLVDQARQNETAAERGRAAIDAVARIMTSLAGNLPNYEEATRFLYRRDPQRFAELIASWPADVRAYLTRLLQAP